MQNKVIFLPKEISPNIFKILEENVYEFFVYISCLSLNFD